MEEVQLRNFLAVVQSGSISLAAKTLGVAQPSLSQQVLRLEDELKMTLFSRSARGVALTDAGRVFRDHAREILSAMQRARDHVAAYEATPHGPVNLVVRSSTNRLLGVPLIIACKQRFPEVAIRVQEATSGVIRRSVMAAANVDLAIAFCAEWDTPNTAWPARRIGDETLFLIGRGGEFGEVDARGVALKRVSADFPHRVNLIVPSVAKHVQVVGDDGRPLVFGFPVGMEIDSLSQILTLVAAGQGYSILSYGGARELLGVGRLSAARIEGVDLKRSISIMRNTAKPVTRASLEVEDLVVELLAPMLEEGA